ncbi:MULTISPECIES: response regulator transcription factor [Vagococcus]|uniref:response regulator transcription factor n=1 Tax=Vagococcus TaxID=2737 RepID=UPI000E4AEB3F|nr:MULTISPECIES: response regulator transcription factor [Vagococcus]RHH70030.1 DNA-binding response regulator [Vagococcus sp. AM17-17]
MINILVIEDEKEISHHIRDILVELGNVAQVYDGEEALYEVESGEYDFVILDLMLPNMDGVSILKKLRNDKNNIPILILTAKDSLDNKLEGFKVGTDDYLTKPFHREELLMRSKAILKRTFELYEDNTLSYGDLTCLLLQREVKYQDNVLPIQGKEYDLLVYLLQNKGIILTKEQIFNRIWGYDSDTALSVVEVHMSHLRKHLKETNLNKQLTTIRNVGYILQKEDAV